MSRPENVKHWNELLDADDATYPNDDELMTISSRFSDAFRLFRFGVGHHVLKPGRRTSYPHAELAEEEFVYVLEGTPDLWQDGHLHRLQPGDGVGWPSGTGIAHCLINNTASDVRLLVVGEPSRRRYGVHYPLHPSRNAELGEQWWRDAPKRELRSARRAAGCAAGEAQEGAVGRSIYTCGQLFSGHVWEGVGRPF